MFTCKYWGPGLGGFVGDVGDRWLEGGKMLDGGSGTALLTHA